MKILNKNGKVKDDETIDELAFSQAKFSVKKEEIVKEKSTISVKPLDFNCGFSFSIFENVVKVVLHLDDETSKCIEIDLTNDENLKSRLYKISKDLFVKAAEII